VEWPIDPIFVDRWSPRAMAGQSLTHAELMPLLEAARWAPSASNFQPWRFLYTLRDGAHWSLFFDLLKPGNRSWAERAGALVMFISRTHLDGDGKASVTHSYDTGAAWQNLALQGSLNGLAVHGIQGFDYVRARTALNIPDAYSIEAMAVVGKPGDMSLLSESQQQKEIPSDRRPLSATACEGPFAL
jgi:nitroreductase